MNGVGLEMLYDPLDLYVWVFFLRILFHFELFNVIYFIGVTFFLHCLVYFEKKTLVIFVSMLPWITEYIALPSLALSSLFCWLQSKSHFVHSLSKKVKISRVGFHDCCFSQDKSSQKCNRKPSPIKELVWRCLCFLSWKPKSCLHLIQCFSDAMFLIFLSFETTNLLMDCAHDYL